MKYYENKNKIQNMEGRKWKIKLKSKKEKQEKERKMKETRINKEWKRIQIDYAEITENGQLWNQIEIRIKERMKKKKWR